MSIYDLPAPACDKEETANRGTNSIRDAQLSTQLDAIDSAGERAPGNAQRSPSTPTKVPKKRRTGCGGCLIGCLGVIVVLLLFTGAGGWFVWCQWPKWARSAVASALADIDLPDQEREEVMAQLDRVINGYRGGDVTADQLSRMVSQLGKSRLAASLFAESAFDRYITPSGLREEEKQIARKSIQRVSQGVVENRIDRDSLSEPLDLISTRDGSGNRRLRDTVSDQELRELARTCKNLADEARIPMVLSPIDIGDEVKRVVDDVLQQDWP
jgi:hypothetical protein